MNENRPLNGRDIGEAQRATSAVLDVLLASLGTTFERWVVLNGVATFGPSVLRRTLVDELTDGMKVEALAVEEMIDDVELAGLVLVVTDVTGTPRGVRLTLTAAGRDLHRQVQGAIAEVTEDLYAAIPRHDLEVARLVLAAVTSEANAWLRSAGAAS